MWFIFALMTFFAWGTADLFYKKGAEEEDKYSHLKTSIMVGLVMGIVAFGTIIIKGIDYDPVNLMVYFPVSVMYILSMTVGYFGLRYLELSVSSPIQNASGAVSCLIMMFVLQKLPSTIEIIAIIFITIGVILLGMYEKQKEDEYMSEYNRKYRIGMIAFFMPILYCVIDSFGTALDGIFLDDFETTPLKNVTPENFEDVANISYMLTFFIVAVILSIYVYVIKKQPLQVKEQGTRGLAAVCEAAGQITYVYAMSGNGMVAAPMIGSYCVASVVLARFFLKEELSKRQYLMVGCVFVGILLLGIAEGLAE